jgi:hypothetical protein
MLRSTVTRRDFLKLAATTTVSGAVTPLNPGSARPVSAVSPLRLSPMPASADAVIWINLVGGPSPLDTWDPKPEAPLEVRGPFQPIRTRTPGVLFSELFPKLAEMSDRIALIRSLHHEAAAVHETGLQLLQTGQLAGDGPEWPNLGAVVNYLRGRLTCPTGICLPQPRLETGLNVSQGFSAGFLPVAEFQPFLHDTAFSFSAACQTAARLIGEYPFITINMFSGIFDQLTWDCHAAGGSLPTTLRDYRDTVAPLFDNTFTELLQELEVTGRLERTLVVATGEMGRTPYLNPQGGRDHWTRCWTAILAGGGIRGGQVLGASDSFGGEPADRPVRPAELVATVYHALGIPANTAIPGPAGEPVAVADAQPVLELF